MGDCGRDLWTAPAGRREPPAGPLWRMTSLRRFLSPTGSPSPSHEDGTIVSGAAACPT